MKRIIAALMIVCMLLPMLPVQSRAVQEWDDGSPDIGFCEVYLDYCRSREEELSEYEQMMQNCGEYDYKSVCLKDLTGDGIPEFIMLVPEKIHRPGFVEYAELRILTCEEGKPRLLWSSGQL